MYQKNTSLLFIGIVVSEKSYLGGIELSRTIRLLGPEKEKAPEENLRALLA